jgi:fructose-bisphosphate aldolase class I
MQSEKKCFREELAENAKKIGRPGFGILAADESTGTIGKKFVTINLENTAENRRRYRELLFTTPEFEKYISGVIVYDETARQNSSTGESFISLLVSKGVLPGIKVDEGL